jgi:ribosome recycling factor
MGALSTVIDFTGIFSTTFSSLCPLKQLVNINVKEATARILIDSFI